MKLLKDEIVSIKILRRLKGASGSSRFVVIPGAGHELAGVTGTGSLAVEFLRTRLQK